MNAAIDIGNTNLKCAIFDDELLIDRISMSNDSTDLNKFLIDYKIDRTIVAGSGDIDIENIKKNDLLGEIIEFDRNMISSIHNKYETPHLLGQDRIINCLAASYYFPNKNNLIIDMGTCMTITFVDSDNNLLGGSISPGYYMRAKALKDYTHALPMIDLDGTSSLLGTNTTASILSGVQMGTIMEINGRIESYMKDFSEINVILTGGDAPFFENLINYKIFADSNFTLKGLNLVLKDI